MHFLLKSKALTDMLQRWLTDPGREQGQLGEHVKQVWVTAVAGRHDNGGGGVWGCGWHLSAAVEAGCCDHTLCWDVLGVVCTALASPESTLAQMLVQFCSYVGCRVSHLHDTGIMEQLHALPVYPVLCRSVQSWPSFPHQQHWQQHQPLLLKLRSSSSTGRSSSSSRSGPAGGASRTCQVDTRQQQQQQQHMRRKMAAM